MSKTMSEDEQRWAANWLLENAPSFVLRYYGGAMDEEYENRVHELFELFVSVQEEFDESEYQQGKKDGLRLALAIMQHDHKWKTFNRGEAGSREGIIASGVNGN